MNRHAAIDLDWPDKTRTYRLGLVEIEELEEKRGTSLFTLAARLSPGVRDARLADIMEVIRIALIGGAAAPGEALALVRRYVDERALDESRDIAYAVVLAGLARVHGAEAEGDPPLGEDLAAKSSA